jgi:hypothetical protein
MLLHAVLVSVVATPRCSGLHVQASCQQRAGRAGRVRPGHSFRLCTEDDYRSRLPDASVPEMQRSELASLLLQLKVRGFFSGGAGCLCCHLSNGGG